MGLIDLWRSHSRVKLAGKSAVAKKAISLDTGDKRYFDETRKDILRNTRRAAEADEKREILKEKQNRQITKIDNRQISYSPQKTQNIGSGNNFNIQTSKNVFKPEKTSKPARKSYSTKKPTKKKTS